jgi:hypothetical protein
MIAPPSVLDNTRRNLLENTVVQLPFQADPERESLSESAELSKGEPDGLRALQANRLPQVSTGFATADSIAHLGTRERVTRRDLASVSVASTRP